MTTYYYLVVVCIVEGVVLYFVLRYWFLKRLNEIVEEVKSRMKPRVEGQIFNGSPTLISCALERCKLPVILVEEQRRRRGGG